MKESLKALGKIRGYTYLVFVFELLLLVHKQIANIFHTTDRRILYGLVALVFFQVTVCLLWIVKYLSVMQGDKMIKTITMYSSRVRVYLMIDYLLIIGLVINDAVFKSDFADKIMVLLLILMVVYVLRAITILQRRNYPQLHPEDQARVDKKGFSAESRVGANKAQKKAKKKKK